MNHPHDLVQHLESIESDVKVALDKVFFPLKINTNSFVEDGVNFVTYQPPFYLDQILEPINFGVNFDGDPPAYPVNCFNNNGMGDTAEFTVLNPSDWINHVEKYVVWYDQCVELMNRFSLRFPVAKSTLK